MQPSMRFSWTILPLLSLLSALAGCSTTSLDPNRFASEAAEANRDEWRLEKSLRELCASGLIEFCEKESRVLLENGKTEAAKVAAAMGCVKNRASACALQGDILLAEGKVADADQILSHSCDSKTALDGAACPGAGEAAFLRGDPKRALRYWKRGCQQGSLVSCYFEGKAHRLANRVGDSMPPLKKACDARVLGACSELGISIALEGRLEPALEKFAIDCERRSHRACRWLPLLEARLKTKDLDKTLEKDCRQGNSQEACYDSIVLQFLRKGGRALALHRWKENCKAGHQMSCWENFVEENGLKPLTQMNPELEKFCREGILVACYFRGLNFAEAGHRERALPLWKEACGKGEPWSCYLASESELVAEPERTQLAKKACEFGLKRACPNEDPALAEMQVKKSTTVIDYTAACGNGDAEACAYLGTRKAAESNEGRASADAKELFRKACLASSTIGCEEFAKALRP
jgi:hypothetical protein